MNPKGNPQNLTPFKPGEVSNPEGRNQYTYRREAEKVFDRLLLESKGDAASRLEKIIDKAIELAEAGKPYALDQILKRVLPPVTKHELDFGDSTGLGALLARVAAIRRARRDNGDAKEADAAGADRADGAPV